MEHHSGWDTVCSASPPTQIHANHCEGYKGKRRRQALRSILLHTLHCCHALSRRHGKSDDDLPAAYCRNGRIDKKEWGTGGVIDQSQFKTSKRYGFDSLIFEQQHLEALRLYIRHVRPHFENNSEDILLETRHGKKFTKLSSILGKLVYSAIGKYIHPTRLRQMVETESSTHISAEQQSFVSEDQKHTSTVVRIR